MNSFSLPVTAAWNGAVPLPELGPIHAIGPEAASFLHGQLSQDMQGMDAAGARLGAYCSVKGRMVADALILRPAEDQFVLLISADVLPATLKKLSMFVMRAKVRLSDASESLSIVGLVGTAAEAALGPCPAQPYAVAVVAPQPDAPQGSATAWVVRLPEVLGVSRALWVGPAADAAALTEREHPLPEHAWAWLEVMSGVPRITQATVDQFVPQMINFELVGGINFKKGCYPGQEIVARSQYRGTLKRRLFLVHGSSPLLPGQEVFSPADPAQPVGLIVNASPLPGQTDAWSALAELKLQHADTALSVGTPDGPRLQLGTLPYTVGTLDD